MHAKYGNEDEYQCEVLNILGEISFQKLWNLKKCMAGWQEL